MTIKKKRAIKEEGLTHLEVRYAAVNLQAIREQRKVCFHRPALQANEERKQGGGVG